MEASPKPFLHSPFATTKKITIAEGWEYSSQEQAVHGLIEHEAIDFAAPRGTPVLSAANGLAIASYQRGYHGYYKNKRVGFGLGNFVIIFHPANGMYTLYAHLERISKEIPFISPMVYSEKLVPPILLLESDKFANQAKEIDSGTPIGEVGDSGLSWGYLEEPGFRPNPATYPSWDETHLHFGVYNFNNGKRIFYDPYNIYGSAKDYARLKPDSLWLKN